MFKKVDIKLDILFFKEDHFIVAYSPALDFSAYGESIKDAQKSFETSFKLYLEETYEKGTLIEDLLDHGWQIQTKPVAKFIPPKINRKNLLQKDIVKEQKQTYNFVA